MKIALELQPCSNQMSGIGYYTFQLSKRLFEMDAEHVRGNYFNFCMRNPKLSDLGLGGKVCYNALLPYGVYRRIWDKLPIPYRMMFPRADITHFFNLSFHRASPERSSTQSST